MVQGEESWWGTFRYPAEFRADAVALARSSDRPIAQVAKELGVNHETLRTWVRAAEATERPGSVEESAKDAEIGRLRKQVAELETEREILRKAAAARAARAADDAHLAAHVRKIHAESGCTYGSPRVHVELRATGRRVNRSEWNGSCASTASSVGACGGGAAPRRPIRPLGWCRTCCSGTSALVPRASAGAGT